MGTLFQSKGLKSMLVIDTVATGTNIKNIMKSKNMKTSDVQGIFGFGTPQAIFKWFRGDSMPTIDNMVILADAFGVAIDDIIIRKSI